MDQRDQSVSARRGPPHAVAQAHLAAADEVMADLIARLGDCTLWHTPREAFPTLCSAIIGQQISTRAAATVEARLREALGGQLEARALLRADEATLRGAGLSAAKARYLRGHTLVSVFLARCLVVYVVNSWIVACREGWVSARRVLLLRTGRRASTQLAALRGLVRALPRFTPQAEGVARSRRGSQ